MPIFYGYTRIVRIFLYPFPNCIDSCAPASPARFACEERRARWAGLATFRKGNEFAKCFFVVYG